MDETLLNALRECITEPGTMVFCDLDAARRRLRSISDTARNALALYEIDQRNESEPE